jgi:capsular polysaccharide transport system permease protein
MERSLWTRLRAGYKIQSRNINALMIRSMMLKYGRENIGFIWFSLEPILLVIGITFVWIMIHSTHNNVKVVEMVLTGYLPLTLWRHLTGPVVFLIRNNVPVLYHRQISIFDVVFARLLLEFLSTTASMLLFFSALIIVGAVHAIRELDYFALGWLMMFWIGATMGMIIAALTEMYEPLERFIGPIQYINLPISGSFILVDWLPPAAQKAIMYHPLVHCYEVLRRGYFGHTIPTHYDIPYFFCCTFVLTFIACLCMERVRRHVQVF